jgi:peptidoglycan hydrolase-like protein with peptidoglycan-binding domain
MAGVSSDEIKRAQQALKARGLNPGIDGKMDAKTQQALRDFQKANKLPVTGILDQRTAEKLGVSLNGQDRSLPRRGHESTLPKSNGSVR